MRSLDAVKSMRIGYDADRVLLVNRVIQRDALNDSTQRLLRRRAGRVPFRVTASSIVTGSCSRTMKRMKATPMTPPLSA